MRDYCVVLCTYPNEEIARKMADILVEEKLVACVNVIKDLTSLYFWEGKKRGKKCCS